jgi:hypothetical protein
MTNTSNMITETAIADAMAANEAKVAKAPIVPQKKDPVQTAFIKFQDVAGRGAIKFNDTAKATQKACGEALDFWLNKQDERAKAVFFAELEFGSTIADRKRIAKHKLRPAYVTEIVEVMDKEAKAAKEEEKLAAANAAALDADNSATSDDA